MKTTMSLILVLFFSLSNIASNLKFETLPKETVTATFKGATDEGKFSFTDAKGATILFDAVDESVEIDLYEETFVGKKFTITFENITEEVTDEDDEPTGEKIHIKTITALKKL